LETWDCAPASRKADVVVCGPAKAQTVSLTSPK